MKILIVLFGALVGGIIGVSSCEVVFMPMYHRRFKELGFTNRYEIGALLAWSSLVGGCMLGGITTMTLLG